jgi:hypothetical protein
MEHSNKTQTTAYEEKEYPSIDAFCKVACPADCGHIGRTVCWNRGSILQRLYHLAFEFTDRILMGESALSVSRGIWYCHEPIVGIGGMGFGL